MCPLWFEHRILLTRSRCQAASVSLNETMDFFRARWALGECLVALPAAA
jgi:hypothetical protein